MGGRNPSLHRFDTFYDKYSARREHTSLKRLIFRYEDQRLTAVEREGSTVGTVSLLRWMTAPNNNQGKQSATCWLYPGTFSLRTNVSDTDYATSTTSMYERITNTRTHSPTNFVGGTRQARKITSFTSGSFTCMTASAKYRGIATWVLLNCICDCHSDRADQVAWCWSPLWSFVAVGWLSTLRMSVEDRGGWVRRTDIEDMHLHQSMSSHSLSLPCISCWQVSTLSDTVVYTISRACILRLRACIHPSAETKLTIYPHPNPHVISSNLTSF